MKRNINSYYIYNSIKIPLKISLEWRKNVRIAIGKKQIFLRIPMLSTKKQIEKHKEWAQLWLDQQFEKQTGLVNRFIVKSYIDGQLIKVNGSEFRIRIIKEDRKTSAAKIIDGNIWIRLPESFPPDQLNPIIKTLLSRILAQNFYQEVKNRINQINDNYVKENYNKLRIKYNKSNWGSCSAKRNINISSRLLFAPKQIQDYVFLHELTHLKELNHSKKFWSMVESVDPHYKEKEKWLKTNGHLCDF